MTIRASNKTANYSIALSAYRNCDDVFLVWRTAVDDKWDQPLHGVLGFAIERQRKVKGRWGEPEILHNRVGFDTNDVVDDESFANKSRPSNIWPFQRYDWTDHGANSGHTVRYRVVALRSPDGASLGEDRLEEVADSGWTDAIEVSADTPGGISAYFNRGFVMSQYVARLARRNGWGAGDIKKHIKELEEPLRRFLSGELRLAILRLIDEAIENPRLALYAALYELSDEELIDRLTKLKGRAHVVLSNGSDKQGDGNASAREALELAGVDVQDRLLGSKGLGHNKFAILVEQAGRKPLKVWSGSTNWAPTGLCTQANNGILLEDPEVAKLFLEQYDRLDEAGSLFPDKLVSANASSPCIVRHPTHQVDVWFTRLPKAHEDLGNDLLALNAHIEAAEQAILYVMFQPGAHPLSAIAARAKHGLYVRGVVSQVMLANMEESFQLLGVDPHSKEYKTSVIQPEGVGKDFSWWVKEVSRAQFRAIGHAITHSKMIVIDPLSDKCKVITGSHNFSKAASEQNDENIIVVHGNRRLAEAYAVACLGTYAHYRWRAYLEDKRHSRENPWQHLRDTPAWQDSYLASQALKQHLALWGA